MHVLVVPSEHYLTSRYPLGGIFQLHQVNALIKAGYKVGVVSPGVTSPRFLLRKYKYSMFDESCGYPIYRRYMRKFYPQRWLRVEKNINIFQQMGLSLYSAYKKKYGKPDLVHAHNVQYAGFVAQAIQREDGIPFVITEHSSLFMSASDNYKWLDAVKGAFHRATALTAVSGALVRELKKIDEKQQIDVIPNIVDPELLSGVLPKDRVSTSTHTFLNIASLDENKNQAVLIQAFAENFKSKNVCLRIGGTGELEARLKTLARQLNVERQVKFLGHLDRRAVQREMQVADCFVLSSRKETFGVVLIEALACGTPIIATRCGGPEDIVNEANGLLVESDNSTALGEAMTKMAENSKNYCREELREGCERRFGYTAFLSNIQRLYARVLSGGTAESIVQ